MTKGDTSSGATCSTPCGRGGRSGSLTGSLPSPLQLQSISCSIRARTTPRPWSGSSGDRHRVDCSVGIYEVPTVHRARHGTHRLQPEPERRPVDEQCARCLPHAGGLGRWHARSPGRLRDRRAPGRHPLPGQHSATSSRGSGSGARHTARYRRSTSTGRRSTWLGSRTSAPVQEHCRRWPPDPGTELLRGLTMSESFASRFMSPDEKTRDDRP